MKRRLPQYIIGLLVLALGIVLVKKAGVGVAPISAWPSALMHLVGMTFGTGVIWFNLFCFALALLVQRKADVKTLLIFPVSIVFGYVIDFYNIFLLPFGDVGGVLGYLVCLCGIATTALGVVIIVGANMILPAPDAFARAVSAAFGWPLGRVKIAVDSTWMVTAAVVELVVFRQVYSVWIGTVLSALLTGKLVGVFSKRLPWLRVNCGK